MNKAELFAFVDWTNQSEGLSKQTRSRTQKYSKISLLVIGNRISATTLCTEFFKHPIELACNGNKLLYFISSIFEKVKLTSAV